MSISKRKVVVGMSGGVDSSVSALLLQQQGFHVEGLFMKNWEEDDGTEHCSAIQDLADAQSICDKLEIKLHKVNFSAEYWDNVFELFLQEYRLGRTPNPDVLCNKEIKFKAFLDYAQYLQADYIAMGHYAQIEKTSTDTLLKKAVDSNKDQTYFLHQVGYQQLKKALFPIGHLQKDAVRSLAKKYNLVTHNKKDSTGICFIGERRFKDFLKTYIPAQPGPIKTDTGIYIGQHSGLMFHTIGQRQGLGIGGVKNASESPWYVLEKDIQNNTLIIGQGNQHPLLFSQALITNEIFWISKQAPTSDLQLTAKIRYRQNDQRCHITRLTSGKLLIHFEQPQRAITLGQSVVIYNGSTCLGGGIIEQRFQTLPNIDKINKQHI